MTGLHTQPQSGAPNGIVTLGIHCTHRISGSQLGVIFPPPQGISQSLEMYLICLIVLLIKVGKEELGRNSVLKSGSGDLSKYLWWSRDSYLELPPGHS